MKRKCKPCCIYNPLIVYYFTLFSRDQHVCAIMQPCSIAQSFFQEQTYFCMKNKHNIIYLELSKSTRGPFLCIFLCVLCESMKTGCHQFWALDKTQIIKIHSSDYV